MVAAAILITDAVASWLPWWVAGMAGLGAALGIGRQSWRRGLLVLITATVILVRLSQSPLTPPADDIGRLGGTKFSGTATVLTGPETKKGRPRAVLQLSDGKRQGKVLATLPTKPALAPGDRVTLRGKLQHPQSRDGTFDYAAYLGKDQIYALLTNVEITRHEPRQTLSGALYHQRIAFQDRLEELFPGASGGLLQGVLLGDRSRLPEDVEREFQRTGLTHILALSGYNISILMAVFLGVMGRRRGAIAMAIVVIALFVVMVGPSASIVRAAITGSLLLLSQTLGRPQAAGRLCLITAALLTLENPRLLRYDVGFDLSFLATLGIIYGEPLLRPTFQRLPKLLAESCSVTLAAGILTAPLILLTFGSVSLVSPLANMLVVPLIPWMMLGGFVATSLSFVSLSLGEIVAVSTDWLTQAAVGSADWLATWPAASIEFQSARPFLAAVFLLLNLSLMGRLWQRARNRRVAAGTDLPLASVGTLGASRPQPE